MIKKIIILLLLSFVHLSIVAQKKTQNIEMADVMRSNGKIYVVVAVLGLILLGVFLYLFLLDKKIGKLEKETRDLD